MNCRAIVAITCFAAAGCSEPAKVDIDFNNLAPLSAAEKIEEDRLQALIDARWNRTAKAINARKKEYYNRGQAACANLEADYPGGHDGCPRPAPDYLKLR